MNFGFLGNIPWFGVNSNTEMLTKVVSTSALLESPRQSASFDVRHWGWSVISIVPWAFTAKDKIKMPNIVNKELKRQAQQPPTHSFVDASVVYYTPRFRPYVSKVPWHTGARAFLSQLFPRYGHYCGPNWSSGKDGGSLLWDKRPIDWLDFCCYCHDMGYDTHDQAGLLKADMAFLECLERRHMSTKGDVRVAHLYKTMCISGTRLPFKYSNFVMFLRLRFIVSSFIMLNSSFQNLVFYYYSQHLFLPLMTSVYGEICCLQSDVGLRSILVPYRKHLVKLQSQQVSINFGWLSNIKWKRWNMQKT